VPGLSMECVLLISSSSPFSLNPSYSNLFGRLFKTPL
jgi:hypothetical protein